MSLGLMYVRLLELLNQDSHSISSRRKTRHYVTLVRRLRLKMIVTFVILGALTLLGLMTLTSCGKSLRWQQSFYCVELSERNSPTKKYLRLEKRIDAWDWGLWDYTNGSYNVVVGMKPLQNCIGGLKFTKRNLTKHPETLQQYYQFQNQLRSERWLPQEQSESWEELLLELNPSLRWPTKEGI